MMGVDDFLVRVVRRKQGMVWLDGGDSEAALACFEEASTVDGANASVHFCKTVALVKVSLTRYQGGGRRVDGENHPSFRWSQCM